MKLWLIIVLWTLAVFCMGVYSGAVTGKFFGVEV